MKDLIGIFSTLDEVINSISASGIPYGKEQKFPLYDIWKEFDNEDNFIIKLAVAGYKPENISITLEGRVLKIETIQVSVKDPSDKKIIPVTKNIALRDWERTFILDEYFEVIDAKYDYGILSISLKRNIPESQKPKNIPIT